MRKRLKSNMFTRTLGLLAILTLLPLSNSHAAIVEYYVDFENGTDGARTCTDANSASDECKTLQYALDTIVIDAGGSRINVEWDSAAMTQTLAATIDIDAVTGSGSAPLVIQGYSVTVGDGVKAIIDGDSAAANIFLTASGYRDMLIRHLELKGSTSHAIGLVGSDRTIIAQCKITNAGDIGIIIDNGSDSVRIIGNEITTTTGAAIHQAGLASTIYYNYIHDTTSVGLQTESLHSVVVGNIIDTTGGHGILGNFDFSTFLGNTVYNATGDCISIGTNDTQHILLGNILDTASDDCVDVGAGSNIWAYGGNVYYDCADQDTVGTLFFNLQADSTVDPGLNNTTFQVGAGADNLGYPTNLDIAATTIPTNKEPGAVMYEETGGGGTTSYGFSN